MELVNVKHEFICEKTRLRMTPYFRLNGDESVYFSSAAVEEYGLFPGLYIHFQNDGDRWYFYCNNDTDGFLLCHQARRGKGASVIWNKALVKLFLKRSDVDLDKKYPFILTNAKLKSDHIFEIDFRNPFEIDVYQQP